MPNWLSCYSCANQDKAPSSFCKRTSSALLELSGIFAADPELEIDGNNTRALEKHYGLLVRLTRIIGAAVLARGSHNVLQGRRFLTQHRMLVVHTLKRSAGIGTVGNTHDHDTPRRRWGSSGGMKGEVDAKLRAALEERVEELAEAFMLLITATNFLEVRQPPPPPLPPPPKKGTSSSMNITRDADQCLIFAV